jgi:hypothetical protein
MWPADQNTHMRLTAGPVFRSVLTPSSAPNCVSVLPATCATYNNGCPTDVSRFLLQDIDGPTVPWLVQVQVILRLAHPQSVLVFSPSRSS